MMPTLVSIEGDTSAMRYILTKRLLNLGYDLLVDRNYMFSPKRLFYQQMKYVGDPRVRFYVTGQTINMHICDDSNKVISCIRKGTSSADFVDFVIWTWGMLRGNRLPVHITRGTIIFDWKRREEWKML
jgi:hypothetical protein